MKSVFLRKLLFLIASAVLLSSLLTAGLYVIFTSQMTIRMKSRELQPKARALSRLLGDVQTGELQEDSFMRMIARDAELWDAQLLLLDANGSAMASSHMPGVDVEKNEVSPDLQKQISLVMAGEEIEAILRLHSTSSPMLVVGTPVKRDDNVSGAVFLAKPVNEVNSAMGGFQTVLISSLFIGLPIVCLFVYLTTRSFTRPMQQMRDNALAMARGNFHVYVSENQRGEMGELAFSLNHLSRELSHTISQLTMERNRLRWVLDSIGDGIAAVNAMGEITHANPSIYRLLELEPGDVRALRELLLQVAPEVFHEKEITESVSRNMVTDGQAVLKLTVSPIEGADNLSAGYVAIFQDVTESERLEQTRREYVANVSHELRTPLTALRGLIEPLSDGMVKREEDRSRFYSIMLRETLRLARLVDDLMQLSRLQSASESVHKQAFELHALLLDVAEKCQIYADEAEVELQVEPTDVRVWGERDRVEQVLIILLDNACKFTPKGGHIKITTQRAQDKAWVNVRDDGAGIAPGDLPHVFERFYKADRARSSGGTGLGLSIAKEVLEQLGERIEVTSKPGEGACFRFSIQLEGAK